MLANEQVLADGTCERSGDLVEKRDLEQWFFKITDYAQQLLDDLDDLDWPERVKTMQRNWIGRSEGAEFDMPVCDADGTAATDGCALRVFTTRPDTSFGMTYAVLAPEHPLVAELTTDDQRAEVEAFVAHVHRRRASSSAWRRRARSTSGASSPAPTCVNPFTGDAGPVYLADYVLATYGTGAIMAVPGQDQRDWDFATAYDLPIVRTVQPPEGWDGEAYTGDGPGHQQRVARRPGQGRRHRQGHRLAGGRRASASARSTTACATGCCRRQRFWGCPIPVVYCDDCGIVPVPDDQLPVLAPDDVEFLPDRRVAAAAPRGLPAHDLPACGGPAGARPTPWTPSSTRPGTSCASPTRGTTTAPFSTGGGRRRGCRSTSTSAGSSTPSST